MQWLRWLPVLVALVAAAFGWWLVAPSSAAPPRTPPTVRRVTPQGKNPVEAVVERVSRAPPPLAPRGVVDVGSNRPAADALTPFARRWLERWTQGLGPAFEVLPRAAGSAQLLARAALGKPAAAAPADEATDAGCTPGAFTLPLASSRVDVLVVVDTATATFNALEPALAWLRDLAQALDQLPVDVQLLVLAESDALATFAPLRDSDAADRSPSASASDDLFEVLLRAFGPRGGARWAASLRPDTPLHVVLVSTGDASGYGHGAGLRPAELRTPEGRADRLRTTLEAALARDAALPPSLTVHALVGAELGDQVLAPHQPRVTARCGTTAGETYQALAERTQGLRASVCTRAPAFEPFTRALAEHLRRQRAPVHDDGPLARWPAVVASLDAVGDAPEQRLTLVQTGTCGRGPPYVWRWDGEHDHLCPGSTAQLVDAGYVALAGARRCPPPTP